jgi:hypothetical protein
VRIDELPYWQVFLLRSGTESGYEHVIVPRKMLELLEQDHVIAKPYSTTEYRTPVDAVMLINMLWVKLDGTQLVDAISLRTHVNLYRKQELAELLKAAKRLELSPTGRVPVQPPPPGNLSKEQVEKWLKEPGVIKQYPMRARATVDMACMVDQATLQLFAGTSVVRDVADGCMFGLRNKLRRAKAKAKGG